jgi:hypothetical protein
MGKNLRQLTRKIVKNNLVWNLVNPLIKVSNYLQIQRTTATSKPLDYDRNFISILGTGVVKNGPFKNLKYPDLFSYGSTIFPKILGSYEYELHDVIERICAKSYTEIINIGSAEGYYAVGMALRMPSAKIITFDIEDKANDFCRNMAKLNNVSERIEINEKCTAKTLADFHFSGRGLIICDCEGFEKQLFDQTNLQNLSTCDLLIETHDFIDITITSFLEKLFSQTHHIEVIESVDDIIKAKKYPFKELEHLTLVERKQLLSEYRPSTMEWYYLVPKNDKN